MRPVLNCCMYTYHRWKKWKNSYGKQHFPVQFITRNFVTTRTRFRTSLSFRTRFVKYNINYQEDNFTVCLVRLYRILRRLQGREFRSIWSTQKRRLRLQRWQSFHWALSSELAHYAHSQPVMHWGFDEHETHDVKEEVLDDEDEVW